ncbi:hypothetical protein DMH04_23235 [Kibdelosporangium aridum]|uniref:Uncharacterized protein n=1 Tax=Kibdelosporangium aridum TaxID=2030 RepID=A0A428Z7E6_KIBAR|nr:hypothetical protein DMH04_23235 [Kibdelosporangium aridum]
MEQTTSAPMDPWVQDGVGCGPCTKPGHYSMIGADGYPTPDKVCVKSEFPKPCGSRWIWIDECDHKPC